MLGAVNVAVMGVSMGWWKRSHNTHHVRARPRLTRPSSAAIPMTVFQ